MRINNDCLTSILDFLTIREVRNLYCINKKFKEIILDYIINYKFKLPIDFKSKYQLLGHDILTIGLYNKFDIPIKKKDCYDLWTRLNKTIQSKLTKIANEYNKKNEYINDKIFTIENKIDTNKPLDGKTYYSYAKYNNGFCLPKEWEFINNKIKAIYYNKATEYNEKYIFKSDIVYELKKPLILEANKILTAYDYFSLAKHSEISYTNYSEWILLNKQIKEQYRKLSDEHNILLLIDEPIYPIPENIKYYEIDIPSAYDLWYISKFGKKPSSLDQFDYWSKIIFTTKNYYYDKALEYSKSNEISIL